MNEKLRNLRYEKGYTTRQMSEMLGISKAFYCQLENNKRTLSYKMAYRMAKIFNLKPDDVFYEDFNERM